MGMRELEEELRELQARYRVMVEHAPDAIVVFSLDDGKFVEANQPACELYGMSRDELLAVGPVEMSPQRQPGGTLSATAAPALIQRAMAGEIPWFEWTHSRADGTPVLCRVQLARLPSEHERLVRASVVDISALKESEKARDRFRALLDATPDIVGFADAGGRAQYLNPAGRELLGLGATEDISGLSIAAFHTDRWAKRILDEAVPIAIRDGVWRGESEFRDRDGSAFPTSQVLLAHTDHDGDLEYLSTIARDMRDKRAAEQLQRKVMHAQKLESLGVLAGGIAHDFNNILVGILANASLALERLGDDDPTRPLVSDILSAGTRAGELAQQMLAYAGKHRATLEPLHVSDLARDVSSLVTASISKSARLGFDFGDGVPPILGDATQLRQVLMNLVLNASEALGDEAGDITVRTRHARADRGRLLHSDLVTNPDAPLVMLEVVDGGSGIEAPLERIFDPFFTTKFAGRGLGLAALMGIVRAHRGAIEVETAPGRGTSFRLWFAPTDERAPIESPAPPDEPDQWAPRGIVLVVDDEPMVRRALKAVIEGIGFEVLTADHGADAEGIFAQRHDDVVAVVLDLTMPGMSGHEVLERLRAIDADTPIVLTSGYNARVDASKADGFLSKPFTHDDIVTVLRDAMTPSS